LGSPQETEMKDVQHSTSTTNISEENINYTDEDNWTVDFFVSHQEKKIEIQLNKKKIAFRGYTLKARWKGFSPNDDTIEPLHSAAEHHKAPLLAYLQKHHTLVSYIKENAVGVFSADFVEELSNITIA